MLLLRADLMVQRREALLVGLKKILSSFMAHVVCIKTEVGRKLREPFIYPDASFI